MRIVVVSHPMLPLVVLLTSTFSFTHYSEPQVPFFPPAITRTSKQTSQQTKRSESSLGAQTVVAVPLTNAAGSSDTFDNFQSAAPSMNVASTSTFPPSQHLPPANQDQGHGYTQVGERCPRPSRYSNQTKPNHILVFSLCDAGFLSTVHGK